MSDRETLVDLLRVPPTPEESAVLASLKGRYRGERLYRERVDYLTGRVQHVAGAPQPAGPPTKALAPVWLVPSGSPLLDGLSGLERQLWYALVAGWLLDHRGLVVEVREPWSDERPVCDMGGKVDAKALALGCTYADESIACGPVDDARMVAVGVECARSLREREAG